MNRHHLSLFCVLVLLPTAWASAQRIPLEGNERIVQLHDVGDLVGNSWPAPRPGIDPIPSPEDVERQERTQLEAMAEFARTFMQPPLDGEDDIRPLGRRHLVALARPEQQAWLEDLLRRQREAGDHQMFLEVQQLKLFDAQYEKVFQPLLEGLDATTTKVPPGSESPLVSHFVDAEETRTLAVLSKEHADRLMVDVAKAKVDRVHAPRLVTRPMMHANMSVLREIEYTKDFDVVIDVAGETTTIPVQDKIDDGIKVAVSSGLVDRDLIGLTLNVEVSETEQPIATFDTELEDGRTVTIDLPNVRTYRLDQKLILPDGGTGLFAVRRESGTHIVFLATVAILK